MFTWIPLQLDSFDLRTWAKLWKCCQVPKLGTDPAQHDFPSVPCSTWKHIFGSLIFFVPFLSIMPFTLWMYMPFAKVYTLKMTSLFCFNHLLGVNSFSFISFSVSLSVFLHLCILISVVHCSSDFCSIRLSLLKLVGYHYCLDMVLTRGFFGPSGFGIHVGLGKVMRNLQENLKKVGGKNM